MANKKTEEITKQAFIIRCAPSKISRLDEMITANQIVIGWSELRDKLFDKSFTREEFKSTITEVYPNYKTSPYSLGQATGYLWRFIREMRVGDYALVPTAKAFYLGEIISDVHYLPKMVAKDTAIRRNVKWLNNGKPMLRDYCGAGLVSRLKYQGTCVGATDLIDDIDRSIVHAQTNTTPDFKHQLNEHLKVEVLKTLTSKDSYLDDRKFEQLIRKLLLAMGASTSEIPGKSTYRKSIADVDIIATFIHLGLQIYIQVKKHDHSTDDHAIKQIIEAIKIGNSENDKPILGWAITSGTFTPEAESLAIANAIRIIDGEELSEMILAVGLDKL